jgi:hypothetical protein
VQVVLKIDFVYLIPLIIGQREEEIFSTSNQTLPRFGRGKEKMT